MKTINQNKKDTFLTKEMILDYLNMHKTDLRNKFGVIKIGLFGSFSRDEQKEDSDIDIAIEIEKSKKNIHTFFALKRELEKVFDKKVDLGIESSLKPIARNFIQKEIIYV